MTSIFKTARKLYKDEPIVALRILRACANRKTLLGGTPVYIASSDGSTLTVGSNTFKFLDILRKLGYNYEVLQDRCVDFASSSKKGVGIFVSLFTFINNEKECQKIVRLFRNGVKVGHGGYGCETRDVSGAHSVHFTTLSMDVALQQAKLSAGREADEL